MIVKKDGQMRVYACTLVDDDSDYDLGESLQESKNIRVMLKHHRCYSCFAQGADQLYCSLVFTSCRNIHPVRPYPLTCYL